MSERTEHWEVGEVIHNGSPADDTAIVFTPTGEITVETSSAYGDACLISAAPDMLAALKDVTERFKRCMLSHKNDEETAEANIAHARAAIAKASRNETEKT